MAGIGVSGCRVHFFCAKFLPGGCGVFVSHAIGSAAKADFSSGVAPVDSRRTSVNFSCIFVGPRSASMSMRVTVCKRSKARVSLDRPVRVPLGHSARAVVGKGFLAAEASKNMIVSPDFGSSVGVPLCERARGAGGSR